MLIFTQQMPHRPYLLSLLVILTGCAARQTGPIVYRLVNTGSARVLVPPGVNDPALTLRTFDYRPQRTVPANCNSVSDALRAEPRRGALRITVQKTPLVAHPAPWLAEWTAALEQKGCLSAGEGAILSEQIVEVIPLNPTDAYRLLHANSAMSGYLDLVPGYRLKLVSPILREGAAPGASALDTESITGNDKQLTLTVTSSKDFLGYEVSWYAIEPRPSAKGAQIAFAADEMHVGDQVTRPAQPRTNYFVFPDIATCYRLFYLSRLSQADHNVAILSAPTREELDRQTPAFNGDPDACDKAPARTCIALPKEVAATTYLTITANGAPLEVAIGSTVADALRTAAVARPAEVLSTLALRRAYRGALVAVEFDRSKLDILSLVLSGHEDLRW